MPSISESGTGSMDSDNARNNTQANPRYDVLAICCAISLTLLGLGGWLTYLGLGPWYETLEFPSFQPPPWVFTPVWTVVLALLAVATWLVVRNDRGRQSNIAIGLYGAQCVLNAMWSLLFFTVRRPDIALWELLALDFVVLAMIVTYGNASRLAGLLLIPYLAWVSFATAINGWIVEHNYRTDRSTPMNLQCLNHEVHMREAIAVAKQNPSAPFGAVLVHGGRNEIVAMGVNKSHLNPTWHGEIAAINDYVDQGGTEWNELVLYTTAEPCCMCQGAITWAGISEVVYGTSIPELMQLGWKQIDVPSREVAGRSWQPNVAITGGILASECGELFQRVDNGK